MSLVYCSYVKPNHWGKLGEEYTDLSDILATSYVSVFTSKILKLLGITIDESMFIYIRKKKKREKQRWQHVNK